MSDPINSYGARSQTSSTTQLQGATGNQIPQTNQNNTLPSANSFITTPSQLNFHNTLASIPAWPATQPPPQTGYSSGGAASTNSDPASNYYNNPNLGNTNTQSGPSAYPYSQGHQTTRLTAGTDAEKFYHITNKYTGDTDVVPANQLANFSDPRHYDVELVTPADSPTGPSGAPPPASHIINNNSSAAFVQGGAFSGPSNAPGPYWQGGANNSNNTYPASAHPHGFMTGFNAATQVAPGTAPPNFDQSWQPGANALPYDTSYPDDNYSAYGQNYPTQLPPPCRYYSSHPETGELTEIAYYEIEEAQWAGYDVFEARLDFDDSYYSSFDPNASDLHQTDNQNDYPAHVYNINNQNYPANPHSNFYPNSFNSAAPVAPNPTGANANYGNHLSIAHSNLEQQQPQPWNDSALPSAPASVAPPTASNTTQQQDRAPPLQSTPIPANDSAPPTDPQPITPVGVNLGRSANDALSPSPPLQGQTEPFDHGAGNTEMPAPPSPYVVPGGAPASRDSYTPREPAPVSGSDSPSLSSIIRRVPMPSRLKSSLGAMPPNAAPLPTAPASVAPPTASNTSTPNKGFGSTAFQINADPPSTNNTNNPIYPSSSTDNFPEAQQSGAGGNNNYFDSDTQHDVQLPLQQWPGVSRSTGPGWTDITTTPVPASPNVTPRRMPEPVAPRIATNTSTNWPGGPKQPSASASSYNTITNSMGDQSTVQTIPVSELQSANASSNSTNPPSKKRKRLAERDVRSIAPPINMKYPKTRDPSDIPGFNDLSAGAQTLVQEKLSLLRQPKIQKQPDARIWGDDNAKEAIRFLSSHYPWSRKDLASVFGCSPMTISRVVAQGEFEPFDAPLPGDAPVVAQEIWTCMKDGVRYGQGQIFNGVNDFSEAEREAIAYLYRQRNYSAPSLAAPFGAPDQCIRYVVRSYERSRARTEPNSGNK
ncbi:hypothetical protein [Methylocystis echinoides]|uniref:Uncharacterized protein n=1 Tax=Methylocystis echinoides TaxID=29468 RepID=A0A9W6GWD7_9HYPH|nr:hypothetical protein [Methylocystis echinoides]GLI94173.1 hypothetical protein LMG27198_31650 [Methylocystis echinoides]